MSFESRKKRETHDLAPAELPIITKHYGSQWEAEQAEEAGRDPAMEDGPKIDLTNLPDGQEPSVDLTDLPELATPSERENMLNKPRENFQTPAQDQAELHQMVKEFFHKVACWEASKNVDGR